MVGWLVGFIDNDESEIFDRRKQGGAGTDDDLGPGVSKDALPEQMTGGFGLFGVEKGDVIEVSFEILDELGSEGDFGD